jgi:hypothetical protein
VDVQGFGGHCVIDHNAYAVIGMPFEGKIRTWNFTQFPGTEFEKGGRMLEVKISPPEDPARHHEAPDLSMLKEAGAYDGENKPVYGPRP